LNEKQDEVIYSSNISPQMSIISLLDATKSKENEIASQKRGTKGGYLGRV
jgi:hypothetical protein